MSPQAQRIAIYQALGFILGASLGYNADQASLWYRRDDKGPHRQVLLRLDDGLRYSQVFADPLTDLNAMHEAEKELTKDQQGWYAAWLRRFTTDINADFAFAVYHATAAQRVEAFLRTLGKWEDSK